MGRPRKVAQSLSIVAQLLLEHGADVNAQIIYGFSSLHAVGLFGKVKVLRVLLEHGANVGAEDDDGITAFQVASDVEHEEVMQLLSEHGAGY